MQPIQGPAVRLPGLVLVLLPLRLDRRAHRGLHEGRDRDRAPLLGRDITDGPGPAGLHGATALRPQPGPQGLLARLAKRRGTGRGRGLHEAPPDTPIPDRLARARIQRDGKLLVDPIESEDQQVLREHRRAAGTH